MKSKKINSKVFFPSVILFVLCIITAFINNTFFIEITNKIYSVILDYFGWLFIVVAVLSFILCVVLFFSRFGNIRIGGENAKPKLSKWNWFTITLCTTIGSGIIFWGAAEPLQHMLFPPESLNIEPLSAESALFAMSTIFKHWTLLPYALYTIVAVVFAFVYYNMKKNYSIGSMILPFINTKHRTMICTIIDFLCIFSLVVGLSASLYAAVLSLNGGLSRIFYLPSNPLIWAILIGITSLLTMSSALSGINKGIKYLSNFNVWIYIIILCVLLIFGGTVYICSFATESIGVFVSNFFESALFTGKAANDPWAKNWTMYYFANWLAWTPVTGVFLGNICYGRKIKEIIAMNLFVTALFSVIWFAIISGATINQLLNFQNSGLIDAFNAGYENVIYQVFNNLHLDKILTPLFLIAVLISLITASDSTIFSISSLCSNGISPTTQKPHKYLIVVWVTIVGFVTWIMMSVGEGITGLKILSNIGGFPSMILVFIIIVSAIILCLNGEKYNYVDN